MYLTLFQISAVANWHYGPNGWDKSKPHADVAAQLQKDLGDDIALTLMSRVPVDCQLTDADLKPRLDFEHRKLLRIYSKR